MTLIKIENEPLRPALVHTSERVNYADMWDRVDGFTEDVLDPNCGPGRYEVVFVEDDECALLHMLSALASWGAAGMVNSEWPTPRFVHALQLLHEARRTAAKRKTGGKGSRARVTPPRLPVVDRDESSDERALSSLTLHRDIPALVVFSSGSSGDPKAAVLSAGNMLSGARAANRLLELDARSRWLLSLPLYHVSGLSIVFRCLLASAAMVLPEEGEELGDVLIRHAPTHVSLVATQLYRLLRDDASAAALARCKAVVMGGGPTPESLVREAVARGIKLVMSYGMTETAAMICCTRPGDAMERLLSSGKPLVDGSVSISSEGEILVRGDQLFLGYLQPDGSLHRPLTDEGWFRTGDLGRFDDAGYLHVTGRRDNMFISGGENIQPEEIEQALRNIEGVEEAIVVPVDDAEWGRRPVAFVRMEEGRALDAAAVEKDLRETLPGHKIPRAIRPWPADLAQPGLKPARRDFEKRAKELATD